MRIFLSNSPRPLRLCERSLFLLLLFLTSSVQAEDPSAADFFEREVRPILVEHCQSCHGAEKTKASLNLLSRASLLQGGDSGPAAEPGKPDESLLIQYIRYGDVIRMPPKGKLPDSEIATLTHWVEMGLPWPDDKPIVASSTGTKPTFTDEQRQFWSFQPLADPEPPTVKSADWPSGDIDRFILARLESEGLRPAPPADRRSLIRRVTFDLTGLPPTTAEVEAFLRDESPDAFARVVDRLLGSAAYGERWGRHWLDLVRYADSRDSRGIGGDSDITEAWRYRDWVINAFNHDQPYDCFLIDQLAGDLLPGDGPNGFNAEGLVATGLLCIGEWGTGDADKDKMMTDIVDDQIDVVGRTFLGLTLACARCHDHKFDPILQRDYYALAGIFFSTHILPDPGAKTAGSPLLRTPIVPPSIIAAAEQHKKRVAELEAASKKLTEEAGQAFAAAESSRTRDYLLAAWDHQQSAGSPDLEAFAASRSLNAAALRGWISALGLGDAGRLMDQPVSNLLGSPGIHAWKGQTGTPSLTVNTTDQAVSLLTFTLPRRSVSVHPSPTGAVAVTWTSPIAGQVRVAGGVADSDPAGGDGIGWSLAIRHGPAFRPLAEGAIPNGGRQRFAERNGDDALAAVAVQPGDVLRLAILPKNSHTCDTTTLDWTLTALDSGPSWDLARDLVADPIANGQGNPHADTLGHAAVWRFADLGATPTARTPETAALWKTWDDAVASEDRDAIASAADAFQEAANSAGSPFHKLLLAADSPFLAEQGGRIDHIPDATRSRIEAIRAELASLRQNPPPPTPVTLAAQEGGVPNSPHAGIHDARIHIRGSYQRLGDVVPRGFPTILVGDDPPEIGPGSGRLELARWIASPENPLMARVMVNRIWQYHFGTGIVRTPSNFGAIGERPTHPLLLDHLARRFLDSGWSIKALHRAILLSRTYQQSSRPDPETLAQDPENRLYGRMNRRRLESEAIRDALLAVSGRLDPSPGGPAYREFETPRRTIYHMTIRSDRSSYGPLFDAADSTAIVDRRTESTVAPQALFLLNHPFVLARAGDLADRMAREAPDDNRGRIDWLYQTLYARPPSPEESRIGADFITSSPVEKAAAWKAYCHILLCANEFLYID